MLIHHFTLIVDGADLQDESVVNSLFESGCDDALIGVVDGVQFIDFDRDAAGLGEAVLSAVADIERVEGVRQPADERRLDPGERTGTATPRPRVAESPPVRLGVLSALHTSRDIRYVFRYLDQRSVVGIEAFLDAFDTFSDGGMSLLIIPLRFIEALVGIISLLPGLLVQYDRADERADDDNDGTDPGNDGADSFPRHRLFSSFPPHQRRTSSPSSFG